MKKSFTLIELLIVVAILGILSLVSFKTFGETSTNTNNTYNNYNNINIAKTKMYDEILGIKSKTMFLDRPTTLKINTNLSSKKIEDLEVVFSSKEFIKDYKIIEDKKNLLLVLEIDRILFLTEDSLNFNIVDKDTKENLFFGSVK